MHGSIHALRGLFFALSKYQHNFARKIFINSFDFYAKCFLQVCFKMLHAANAPTSEFVQLYMLASMVSQFHHFSSDKTEFQKELR